MTDTILCCGEALMDFIPIDAVDGAKAYRPCPGGSVYNVARALGRLNAPTELAGGISSDFMGDELVAGLEQSKVGLRFVQRMDAPTTIGFVSLHLEEPEYAFYDTGAAERIWEKIPEADALAEVGALHFGSISLVREPAGTAYEKLMLREADGPRVISFDPNIRPALVKDEAAFRARLQRTMNAATIVKISAADLEWIAPGADLDQVAQSLLAGRAGLVAITKGGDGVIGWTRHGRVQVPVVPTKVADTVGAGDSFMAGLLAGLREQGCLSREKLASLDENTLRAALAMGQATASLTCAKRGADAPWRHEITL